MTLRIDNLRLWDGRNHVLSDASLLIDDGRIVRVSLAKDATDFPQSAERIDGRGKLAIPGLVNAHTHLYSSLARGMSISPFAPKSFTEILEQLWWKLDKALDPESVRISALIGAMEAARCGVTTLVDHHASPNAIAGSLDALKEAVVDKLGLRAAFCYELSDRDGIERRDQGIAENLRTLSLSGSDKAASQFGIHASFTVSDETLALVSKAIPEGAGIHIHVAEGPEDEVQCVANHGMRVVERLDRFDLLRPQSILAHCLHIDESEKDLIAERDAIVVHNPRSNMNNAVGQFDLDGFLKRDITTGLGTDGLGANMLAELFTAGILQKHSRGSTLAGSFDALYALLFVNNPAIAGRLLGIDLGQIVSGAPADLVLLDYVPPTPFEADNALGHLLFGIAVHSLQVADSFVAGRRIIADGQFVDLDEEAIYAHAREQAASLWKRLG
ncbi:putative aminohydrolase SsnA [Candidatus Bipolaricaulota bacterium]